METKRIILIALSALVALSCVAGMPSTGARTGDQAQLDSTAQSRGDHLVALHVSETQAQAEEAQLVANPASAVEGGSTLRLKRQTICNGAICTNFGSGTGNIGK